MQVLKFIEAYIANNTVELWIVTEEAEFNLIIFYVIYRLLWYKFI